MKIILIADSDLKRTKGLMFHDPLEIDECAFFTFPREGKHSFWNNNVSFPISLLFCNKDKKIIDIKDLKEQQKKSISPSSYDVKYVIETHIDAPKKYDFKKGDILNILIDKKEVLKKL